MEMGQGSSRKLAEGVATGRFKLFVGAVVYVYSVEEY